MDSSTIYDVLIVGSGPAGLSAATTICRQAHKILVLDSGKYRNAASQHMHAVTGWDHRSPDDFRKAAIKEYERYGCVTIEPAEARSIEKLENGLWKATDINGKTHFAHKVVLATGVEDVYPDINGYSECWVSGM